MVLDGIAGIKFILDKKPSHCLVIIKAHFHYYELISSFLKKRKLQKSKMNNPNLKGRYNGWVVWDYFAKGKKYFSQLEINDFK